MKLTLEASAFLARYRLHTPQDNGETTSVVVQPVTGEHPNTSQALADGPILGQQVIN